MISVSEDTLSCSIVFGHEVVSNASLYFPFVNIIPDLLEENEPLFIYSHLIQKSFINKGPWPILQPSALKLPGGRGGKLD